MDDMANSAGSAEREMAIIMDSVDYKANKLKETGTGIAQNLFKRDDMKNVIDTLTWFGERLDWITDKLGLFGTIGLGAGLFAGIKNFGGHKILEPHKTIVLKLPNIISVLWDTKVFLWSNVKYTG